MPLRRTKKRPAPVVSKRLRHTMVSRPVAYAVPPELRHLSRDELRVMIRAGEADVLPFCDARGRAVVVSRWPDTWGNCP